MSHYPTIGSATATGNTLDGLDDTLISGAVKGDIVVYNGTDWVDLTVGADDQVLSAASGEATGLIWNAGGGGYENDTLTTTDATVTTISTIPWKTASDQNPNHGIVTARLSGRNSGDFAQMFWKEITFGVRKGGMGSATLVGESAKEGASTGATTWDVTVAESGGANIFIQVTGEAAKTINWVCDWQVKASQ